MKQYARPTKIDLAARPVRELPKSRPASQRAIMAFGQSAISSLRARSQPHVRVSCSNKKVISLAVALDDTEADGPRGSIWQTATLFGSVWLGLRASPRGTMPRRQSFPINLRSDGRANNLQMCPPAALRRTFIGESDTLLKHPL